MNCKMICAGFAAATILATSLSAHAADLGPRRYKAPAYSAPANFSWNGFYVGIVAGYGMGKSNWTALGASTGDFNVKGLMAAGTLGYNFQTGTWVWGLEGDLGPSWMKGSAGAVCVPDCETKNTWFGTARGRIGYAGWTNWLPYITGGGAFGNIEASRPGAGTVSKNNIGYALGAGVEYAFWGGWSTKLEYLYVDLGKANCPAASCIIDSEVKLKANVLRVGLNHRF